MNWGIGLCSNQRAEWAVRCERHVWVEIGNVILNYSDWVATFILASLVVGAAERAYTKCGPLGVEASVVHPLFSESNIVATPIRARYYVICLIAETPLMRVHWKRQGCNT